MRLVYAAGPPAAAAFDETTPTGGSIPAVDIDYSALLDGGRILAWRCMNGPDAQGTFRLTITSIASASHGDFGTSESDTVHGTVHAICPPNSAPTALETPGQGWITIEGPF